MLDWLKTLTEDNQIKLMIVFIMALLGGLGYLLKKLLDKKQPSTAQPLSIAGDTNTQTTHGGTSALNTGSGQIHSDDNYL